MPKNYEPLQHSPKKTERSSSNKQQQRYPTGDYDSSNSSYDGKDYNAPPRRMSTGREQRPDRVQRQLPSSEEESNNAHSETPYAALIRRESSKRPGTEQLKNQRPWSYINPNELPSSANKMNQYYVDM